MNSKPTKALLKVGYACNNNCVFCHSAPHRGTDATLKQLETKIREAASLGAEMLVLSGGEPTVRPDLLQIADLVIACGMQLGLVTNGRMLAYEKLSRQLQERRLGYLYVSLCGPDAALHDRHSRVESFDQTIAGLKNCVKQVPESSINVVVTAWNKGILKNFIHLSRTLSPIRLKFSFIEPEGNALTGFEELVPPLAEAAEAVVAAVESAPPHFEVAVDGFPLCLLGDHLHREAGLREDGFFIMSEAFQDEWYPVDDRNRDFAAACASCSLRRRCRGVFKQYLKHRGADELRPVELFSPNSFNFAPQAEPEELDPRSCSILAGEVHPPDPVRGIALEEQPGRIRRYAADTRDFSDETIRHVVRDLGQVYLDRSEQAELTDFAGELEKLFLAPTCTVCPKRPLCGGVWQQGPDSSFEKARKVLSGLLSGLEGRVLEVGSGPRPDTGAYGRLEEYLGIDPRAAEAEPAPGVKLVATTLEGFDYAGPPFDAVVAVRSLNHLGSLAGGLAKLVDLTAAGGRLLLAEDVVFGTLRSREKLARVESRSDLPFEHRFNPYPEEVVSLLEDLGVRIIESHPPEETASTLWVVFCEKDKSRL